MARAYDSSVRREQARLTEARIVAAGQDLFVSGRGYADTSMAALAAAADVSAQTIYNTFGSKAALLKRVYDVTLAGDDEPVPMAQRPAFRAMAALDDPRDLLAAYARVGAEMLERVGPLVARVVEGAATGDPDLRDLVDTMDQERLIGCRGTANRIVALDGLRPGLTAERAAETLWALNGFELWQRLVVDRGWTGDAYAELVGRAMAAGVL